MSDEWWKKPRWDDSDWGRYPKVKLDEMVIPDLLVQLITESMARENTVIAVGCTANAIDVAMSDPSDDELLDKLRFALNRPINPKIASEQSILAAINRHYGFSTDENV